MTTTYSKTVKARELPAEWREEGHFAPDEQVTITIVRENTEPGDSPKRFIGAGTGLFASACDVDVYIRRQREA